MHYKKTTIALILFFMVLSAVAQKASLGLKAFQRYHISGLPPTPVIEVGGKETEVKPTPSEPEYFIYLIDFKMPLLKIESLWIKRHLYQAAISKVSCKPVLLDNGIQKDTLVADTGQEVWQIKITGKTKKHSTPAKIISTRVAENELVLRLYDKQGRYYTRFVKNISQLEPARGI
jgi:hypothetical protein